jgi:hypothetical protein
MATQNLSIRDGAGNLVTVGTSLTNDELRESPLFVQELWEDGGYTLNSEGQLISETQINSISEVTRTRTWTYTIEQNGDVVATPGEWA